MLTDGRTDGCTDGRKVITIAHPEQSSGELKSDCLIRMLFQGLAIPHPYPNRLCLGPGNIFHLANIQHQHHSS